MKGEVLAAVLVAATGLLTAVGVQARGLVGDRFQRKVDQAAALLSGYTEMVANLRLELKDCQESAAKSLQAQRDHAARNRDAALAMFQAERERWVADKADLRAEITRLTERLDELMSQVYVLQNRPPEENDE